MTEMNILNGLQENVSLDDFRRLFEIDLSGVRRVIRAVVQEMRSRSERLILSVSSLLGRVALPVHGLCDATKWAQETPSENCRTHPSAFAVEVARVDPAGVTTGVMANLMQPSHRERDAGYGEMAGAPVASSLAGSGTLRGPNPQQASQIVSDAIIAMVGAHHGQRLFRAAVDRIGMGEPLTVHNDHLTQVTEGLSDNLGIADLRKVRTPTAETVLNTGAGPSVAGPAHRENTMKYAGPGTGMAGHTRATALATPGHDVRMGVRDTADHQKAAAVGTGTIAGKTVIDVTNPLDMSLGRPPVLVVHPSNSNSASDALLADLSDAGGPKTLNMMSHQIKVNPGQAPGAHDVFPCGDHDGATSDVRAMRAEFGWTDPIDLGPRAAARGTEDMKPFWLRMCGAEGSAELTYRIVRT